MQKLINIYSLLQEERALLTKKDISVFEKLDLLNVILDSNIDIYQYLHWFDNPDQQKISSFYHYKDRLRAFTSILLQKYYLAKIANINKNDLVINYTKHYKPYIAYPDEISKNLQFNIAHCENYVVLSTYRGNDYYVGVDIELIDNTLNINELGKIVFSEIERSLINNQPTNFFKLWTKKEALIKALGTGFATNFYQDTCLNLENIEINDNYYILTQQVGNYFLSVCLHKVMF